MRYVNDKDIKVSVIVSSYNPVRDQILNAVMSIVDQTFTAWEMIVVDDGSDEHFREVFDEIAALDERIRIIHKKENRGLAAALNTAIGAAKGPYLARMDDDDISAPDRLIRQYEFLEDHREYMWAGSNAWLTDRDGIWGYRIMPEMPDNTDFLKYSPYIHSSVMFRAEIFKTCGRYRVRRRGEDYELFMRFHAFGMKGYNLQEGLIFYREDSKSYGKRSFRSRVEEVHIRAEGFKKMGLSSPVVPYYVIKPAFAGIIPGRLQEGMKRSLGNDAQMVREMEERILKYEKNLQRIRLFSETAGIMRRKDGEDPVTDPYLKLLRAECDNVISPALCGYVLWLIRESLSDGVKRIYFLARDGYLMYRAAEMICKEYDIPIDCRYLFCSRYSIRIPEFHLDPEGALDYICTGGIGLTLGKILNRAGLSADELKKVCEDLSRTAFGLQQNLKGTAEEIAGKIIPYPELGRLKAALRGDRFFMETMKRHSGEAFPALEGYFRQEGLLDEVPMAIADSGWTGSMQKEINRLLRALGKKTCFLSGYYWGLYELPADVDPKEYHCYYFSPDKSLRRKVYFSNNLFEVLFVAPHGLTIGYRKDEGRYIPVTEEVRDDYKRFSETVEKRTCAFTKELLKLLKQGKNTRAGRLPDCRVDIEVIYSQFSLLMGYPTKMEAGLFGSLPFSDDVLEHDEQLAAVMSDEDLSENHAGRKIFSMIGIKKTPIKESAWYEASAVLNGHNVKRHLKGYERYRYLLYLNKALTYRRMRRDRSEKNGKC